jgi:CubicO group peptidase (beta-lactamase class C family)
VRARRAALTVAIVSTTTPLCAQRAAQPNVTPLIIRLADSVRRADTIPGITFAAVRDGRVVYAGGRGIGRLGDTTTITEKSVFHQASISKTFVATAILQLVAARRFTLDTKVTALLPDFAIRGAGADRLTVRHLLEHSSGIPDVTDYAWETPDYDAGALRRFVATLKDSTLQFAPGSSWDYSNTAYEVLGRIIEVTTREIFETYMARRVLRPVGTRKATWLMAIDPRDFVTGHVVVDSVLRVSPTYPYNRRHASSSTLHASATDMAAWILALVSPRSPPGFPTLRWVASEMWEPGRDAYVARDSTHVREGLGWFTRQAAGTALVYHSGADRGFRSCLVLAPAKRAGVAVAVNRAGVDACAYAIQALVMLGVLPAPVPL